MIYVIVDSSVWMNHFKNRDNNLLDLLEGDRVQMHPFILGEIIAGTPPSPRHQTLTFLKDIKPCHSVLPEEVYDFIENNQMFGQGVGFIDFSLLLSALITPGTKLWTFDKRLNALAEKLSISYQP